ncbi:MAG TPA: EF-hand domain-containing protein, partial [Kofleriaceae bacterium]
RRNAMLTKLKLALFIAAPLVAGATTYAVAQPGGGSDVGHGKPEMIQKFDKNGDGKLDDAERAQMKTAFAAERDAKLAERFAAMDKNGDGQLSLDEFKAGQQTGNHRHGRGGAGHHRGHGAGMKR